jgi:hypothetical protein
MNNNRKKTDHSYPTCPLSLALSRSSITHLPAHKGPSLLPVQLAEGIHQGQIGLEHPVTAG